MIRRWHKMVVLFSSLFVRDVVAHAAAIVYTAKRFAVVDAGANQGLSKDDKVCFFEREIHLVACGMVQAIRPKLCGVALSEDDARRVSVGMVAKADTLTETHDTPKATKKEIRTFVKALQKAEGKQWVGPDPDLPAAPVASSARRGLSLGYLASIVTPFRYKIPAYDLSREIARSESLWTSDRGVAMSPLGAELMWTAPFSSRWGWVLGAHYRWFAEDRLTVNYDARNPAVGARGVTAVTSKGFYLGAHRWWGARTEWGWRLGAGLDSDLSQIKHTLTTVDTDEPVAIATLSSRLMVLALRIDSGVHVPIGPVFLDFGLSALVPLSGNAQSNVSLLDLRESVAPDQRDAAESDLKAALAHERSQFGAQVTLGLGASL